MNTNKSEPVKRLSTLAGLHLPCYCICNITCNTRVSILSWFGNKTIQFNSKEYMYSMYTCIQWLGAHQWFFYNAICLPQRDSYQRNALNHHEFDTCDLWHPTPGPSLSYISLFFGCWNTGDSLVGHLTNPDLVSLKKYYLRAWWQGGWWREPPFRIFRKKL